MQLTRKPRGYWTLETCLVEALKYETRSAFQRGSSSCYLTSLRNKWVDRICGHMLEGKKPNGYWTLELCQAEALKYESRAAFKRKAGSALNAAVANNWLDQICSHMKELVKPVGYWTLDRCGAEAAKYKTRSEFQHGSTGAYQSAWHNGWLDLMCGHMTDRAPSDGNCFYLWLVVGAYFNGLPVYKPGVTSTRLKFQRIEQVAKAGGLEYDLVLWLPVTDAYALEAQIKSMGVSPEYTGFNGATEFRALTDDEVKQIKAMALAEFVL
jgi:hypothetical protein